MAKITAAAAKSKKKRAALALQVSDDQGVHHLVAVANIRVAIVPDAGSWFAQGIDIDYAAQGGTVDEAKNNFETGLRCTIEQHLRTYGHLNKFLQVAPPEICQQLLLASSMQFNLFTQISAHDIHEALPGEQIQYLVAAAEAERRSVC